MKKKWIQIIMLLLFLVMLLGEAKFSPSKENSRINILCMGIDKYVTMTERHPSTNSIGQADAIFLVSIDTQQNVVDIIAVPRDTIVVIDKYNSKMEYLGQEPAQICLQYAYADGTKNSCELMEKRVEELFRGISIDAYAAVNFTGIMKINDAIGGVEVTMKEDYTVHNPLFVKGETVLLKGTDALHFIQKRDTSVAKSAYTRIERQKDYMKAFSKKAKIVINENPEITSELYTILQKDMETNLKLEEIVELIISLKDVAPENINIYTLEGEIINDGKYELFYPDAKQLDRLISMIN